jgi:hypothetical protein
VDQAIDMALNFLVPTAPIPIRARRPQLNPRRFESRSR